MSASERLLIGLALAFATGLAACSDDEDPCPRTATFVLRNATSVGLVVAAPAAAPDSVFSIGVGDSVALGVFEGELPGGYPDLRDRMSCLTAWSAVTDTLVFRLGRSAAAGVWVLDETAECAGTFTLVLDDAILGRDDDASARACATDTVLARVWSPAP